MNLSHRKKELRPPGPEPARWRAGIIDFIVRSRRGDEPGPTTLDLGIDP